MPTICPHCNTVRPENTTAPDWQCPSCSKAYAKAGGSMAPNANRRTSQRTASASIASESMDIPWGKILAGLAIAYGAWLSFHRTTSFGSTPSVEQLNQLAASRSASDVMMYSATWCPHCTTAKGWMSQYGFQYQVCETDKDKACAAQLYKLDSSGAVPYLIVRGQHMKNGFDSDEFLAALAK